MIKTEYWKDAAEGFAQAIKECESKVIAYNVDLEKLAEKDASLACGILRRYKSSYLNQIGEFHKMNHLAIGNNIDAKFEAEVTPDLEKWLSDTKHTYPEDMVDDVVESGLYNKRAYVTANISLIEALEKDSVILRPNDANLLLGFLKQNLKKEEMILYKLEILLLDKG